MRAPVSVIIPTLNSAPALPDCLGALIEGLQAGLLRELIISDGGSNDATLEIAAEAGAELLTGAASRGGQLARGAQRAQADWLLFVHSDTVLPLGWAALAAAHIAAESAPAYFGLSFEARGLAPRIVAGWANRRARLFGLPYGDQALLISRVQYEAAGGYPNIPLMEDVALMRALEARPIALAASVKTSAARYEKVGWIRRGSRNLWTLARYLSGADPHALARSYRR